MRLGKKQLRLLAPMGNPFFLLVVGDKLSDSLVKRGLLKPTRGDSLFQITPAGLRVLADAHERGELEQFVDKRFAPVESGKGG